jgi:cytochrome c-type biogenesis protein CcmF
MFLGFAGTAYQADKEVNMLPGQTAALGRYTARFDRLAHEEDRQKEMVTGELTLFVNGKEVDRLRPARWFFHGHENEPTTEVGIRRSPAADFYVTLGNYDLSEGNAMLKLVVNPLVDWIWFGFMILAMGTGIALLPDAVLEKLTVRVPAPANDRSPGMASVALWVAIGLGALLVPRAAHAQAPAAEPPAAAPEAQMAGSATQAPTPVGPDENWLVRNIICQCGTCRHNLLDCASENCGHATQDRIAIHQLLGMGKSRQNVIDYFIQKYGSQVALASPIDKGVNRLIWLLPYGLGVMAAGGLGYGAYRMAHRSAARDPAVPPSEIPKVADEELADELDDELRKLD